VKIVFINPCYPWLVFLVPQRDQWIDFRGSPCRQVARKKRREQQTNGNQTERQQIGRLHTDQQLFDKPCQRPRACQPQHDSDHRQFHSVPHHEPQHVCRARTERHANPDLLRALRHGKRHHAVNPNRREHERDAREDPQHH